MRVFLSKILYIYKLKNKGNNIIIKNNEIKLSKDIKVVLNKDEDNIYNIQIIPMSGSAIEINRFEIINTDSIDILHIPAAPNGTSPFHISVLTIRDSKIPDVSVNFKDLPQDNQLTIDVLDINHKKNIFFNKDPYKNSNFFKQIRLYLSESNDIIGENEAYSNELNAYRKTNLIFGQRLVLWAANLFSKHRTDMLRPLIWLALLVMIIVPLYYCYFGLTFDEFALSSLIQPWEKIPYDNSDLEWQFQIVELLRKIFTAIFLYEIVVCSRQFVKK